MAAKETGPAVAGGASGSQISTIDTPDINRKVNDAQAAGRILAGAFAADADVADAATVLRRVQPEPAARLYCATAYSFSLDRGNAEWLADAVHHHLDCDLATVPIAPDRVAPTLALEAERQARAWVDGLRRLRRARP